MVKTEIRDRLIKRIKEIKDPEVLEEIYTWLEDESQLDIYITNDAQKLEIRLAQEQISRGEGLSDKEANKEIDEWLKGVK